jgi:PAS domain S-box-containing protein
MVASAAAVFTGGGQMGYALGWIFSGTPSDMDAALGQPVMVTMILILLFLLLGLVGGHMSERYAQRRRLQDQAAAQMQRARSEVRNILDNIQSGLLILDQNGVVTRTNPVSEKILGMSAEEMVGQPLATALGPEKVEFAACIQKIIENKRPIARHELTINRGREEIPIGVSVSHLEEKGGQIIGAIAIFQDLTDVTRMRKRIREADRLAGVGELAASIAHEIRNPLGSIRGSVEILASELQLDGQHTQLLELILKESARVNTIINDFLSFARLRPATRQNVACREFLSEVALQIRQHVSVHGDRVRLSHRVDPPDLTVSIDPEQMVQLFLNLAINACEAMDYQGELAIAAERSSDGKWCEMKVQDSGPGIPEDAQSDLFKPFVTTKKTGTGLGLPMVARIANAHAGIVEVGESPTGGAVFCVKVPMPSVEKSMLPHEEKQIDTTRRTAVETTKEPSLAG